MCCGSKQEAASSTTAVLARALAVLALVLGGACCIRHQADMLSALLALDDNCRYICS